MSISKAQWDYFAREYEKAPLVECAYGCGTLIKSKDKYARYKSGHNNPKKYSDPNEADRIYDRKAKLKRSEIKSQIIIERGGKCEICGYKFDGRNFTAFDFHHKDMSKKTFELARMGITEEAIKKARIEIQNCLMICSNCHRLIHNGYFDKGKQDDYITG